jgi:ferredoxin
VPNLQKPSTTARGMRTLVCFVKHMLTGSFATRDVAVQSLNSHFCMDNVERISLALADWLEARGYRGIPVPPEAADMNLQRSPAGTLDFKWVAEESGVGTVGLELNLLTEDYGPRVYIGVVMTDAVLEPTPKLVKHLCPGMKCGRCAVICPTRAIPLQARRDAAITEYRTLDKRACAGGAERIGIKPLLLNLRKLVFSTARVDVARVVEHKYWKDFWQSINSKLGAFAACFECFYVCPPGAKDFRKIIRIPYRKQDIPPGTLQKRFFDDMVEMTYRGVPEERRAEYNRDEDFSAER